MARPRKKLKILLIEPNYSNKYPPIGLMKLSTYHKMLGHEVVFYKGDLKQFVIERIANKCIDEFYKIDENNYNDSTASKIVELSSNYIVFLEHQINEIDGI